MKRRHAFLAAGAVAGALLLTGCAGDGRPQSMLDTAGTAAAAIDSHWQTMLVVGSAVWIVVVVMLVATLLRSQRHRERSGRRAPLFVAIAGAAIPAVILVGIAAESVFVLRDTDPGQTDEQTVVAVTGHQYWWEVSYPGRGVVTANEIHIPTGERVRLEVTSNDVVHSVWVPRLGGKMDMVPGTTNVMWLETDEPGEYWGQCAEYCGLQHARMRFVVVAHEPAEFEGWIAQQAVPDRDAPRQEPQARGVGEVPDPELVARGREVYMSSSCVYCHTVAGTESLGRAGPDLTHLATRGTLGAGVLPNDSESLRLWITDPQAVKPGTLMPGTDVEGDELEALLAYLESLG